MPRHITVHLGGHLAKLVARQVRERRYGSASEVVCAGLRLLEQHERGIEALRAALIEGEKSGSSTPFDAEEFISRKRRKECGVQSRRRHEARASRD